MAKPVLFHACKSVLGHYTESQAMCGKPDRQGGEVELSQADRVAPERERQHTVLGESEALRSQNGKDGGQTKEKHPAGEEGAGQEIP